MNMSKLTWLLSLPLLLALTVPAVAAEDESPAPKRTRASGLFGAPVNVNIAGAGSLPKGKLLTILNASFADKERSKRGGGNNPDVFSQTWLLKLRYGITDRLEVAFTTVYANMERSPKPNGASKHIEGFGDQVMQFTYSFLQQHQGDPLCLSLTAGILFPTGNGGSNHLPGNGAWGYRTAAGVGGFINKDIKIDTEVVYVAPFERGNQKVKRGGQFQWNTNARYIFDSFDLGLESIFTHQESGNKRFADGKRNLKNGYTEWFIGPSINVALGHDTGAWAGVGVFFPVLQHVDGPSKVEDARFEFKIGKLW